MHYSWKTATNQLTSGITTSPITSQELRSNPITNSWLAGEPALTRTRLAEKHFTENHLKRLWQIVDVIGLKYKPKSNVFG